MKINAYAIRTRGGQAEPFMYEREVGKIDVLIKITHCAIAKGDIQIIDNDWGDTKFPVVPGHEIIGVVEHAGSEVTSVKVGDRVGIGYQQQACFACEFCRAGNEQFCSSQKVIGVHTYGGLAEHIVTVSRFVFKLPAKIDAAKSCPLLSSGLTVYSAITRAELSGSSTVAVLGVGGLGQLAIQYLNKSGHKVSAFSHSPQKKDMINLLGAEYLDTSNQNLEDHNRKFDFILSTLNVEFDLDTQLRMLKPQGKLCIVAQPPEKLSLSIGLLYDYAQRTIYGNYTGSRRDMMNMIAFSAQHDIESLVEVVSFSKMNEAIKKVRRGAPVRLVLENT